MPSVSRLAEGVVEHREAAPDALGEHLLAGDDAVALEQQLGERAPPLCGAGRPLGPAAEDGLGQRPATLDLRLCAGAPPPAEARSTHGGVAGAPSRQRPLAVAAGRAVGAGESQARRAQGRPGVVGDLAGPDEVPQRLAQRLGGGIELGEQVGEEGGSGGQPRAQQLVLGVAWRLRTGACRGSGGGRPNGRGVLAEVQRHAPGAPEWTCADPDDLAAGAEAVHPGLGVRAGAPRQHVALPDLDGQREPLQPHEHLAQPVDAGSGAGVPVDALPGGQEGGQAPLVGGLDLLAQRGERGAPEAAQDLDVAPLALAASWPQLAADEIPSALELAQDGAGVDAIAGAQLVGGEGPVRAGVAGDELAERIGYVREEGVGQPAGGHGAERVAVEAGLVGCHPALLPADAQADGAPFALELLQQPVGVDALEHAL